MTGEGSQDLTLTVDDRPVVVYARSVMPSLDPETPWLKRSGFLYDLMTPSGIVLTESMPADHPHQHGVMIAWTSGLLDGQKIDCWNSHKLEGLVEHREVVRAEKNLLEVELNHISLLDDEPETIIRESWGVEVQSVDGVNVVDLESRQWLKTSKEFRIRQYKYGHFCFRGRDDWLFGRCTLTTDEGVDRVKGNHMVPKYALMHGLLSRRETEAARMVGVAVISHPENSPHEHPVRLHPQDPYFSFAPMVAGEFSLKRDEPFVTRYRIITFDGPPPIESIESLRNEFV